MDKNKIKIAAKKRKKGDIQVNIITYVCLIFISLLTVFPIFWALSTSFKQTEEIILFPPTMIPGSITLSSYYTVLFKSNFITYFMNSILVTAICVFVSIAIAAPCSYAIVRFKIRHKEKLMFGILMTSMIPTVALLIPLYIMAVKAGVYNTRFLLVLIYTAWRTPILIWMLRGFFEALPIDIEEAACIDGCSRAKIFYRIVLPMSQPGIVSIALLTSVFVWNDFLVSFTFITKEELRMLSVGLYSYVTQYGIQWGELMAAVMFSIAPIIILFICLQRKFVDGMAAGAVKG